VAASLPARVAVAHRHTRGDAVSADLGGSALERLRARGEEQRLDVVALVWMVLVLAIAAATIYSALRFGNIEGYVGEEDWWFKLRLLVSSGGTTTIFGSAIGIVLAVVFEGARSRLTLQLATVGGIWAGIAGVVGVVVTFHDDSLPEPVVRAFDGRLSHALVYLALAALGILVATVAWRFSRSDTRRDLS
jgi:hypothetical protein